MPIVLPTIRPATMPSATLLVSESARPSKPPTVTPAAKNAKIGTATAAETGLEGRSRGGGEAGAPELACELRARKGTDDHSVVDDRVVERQQQDLSIGVDDGQASDAPDTQQTPALGSGQLDEAQHELTVLPHPRRRQGHGSRRAGSGGLDRPGRTQPVQTNGCAK